MATYAIGDVQGCFDALECLLKKIQFNADKDCLWFVGDLINRGPDSYKTLRFLYELRDNVEFVLGNHDLHFLAVAHGFRKPSSSDTLNELLAARDRQKLMDWLLCGKLLHTDYRLGYTMVHAGIPPQWDLIQAHAYAREVEATLQSRYRDDFLAQMYGNLPDVWKNKLFGMDRLRIITNYFTRMRFCSEDGVLELETKENASLAPKGFAPWFTHVNRKMANDKIIFGHWASLQGNVSEPNVFAMDTGCVWGGTLTAMRLEDQKIYSCNCLA